MSGPGPLTGRVALVTGATSGIGRACAAALASRGASVAVGGRDASAADACAAEVRGFGSEAVTTLGDVADSAAAARMVQDAVSAFGRLDVVVNGAGIIVRADAVGTSDEQWRRQMAVNVDGTFFVSRAALPHLRAAGGGSIVNIASNVGLVGSPGLAGYCASKSAVVGLTRAMALDHADEGIRVNAVCPGAVDTPMLASGRDVAPMTQEEAVLMNEGSIPQGRVATAAEVAELVAFLAADTGQHITGTALPIDGGYTAQ